MDEVKEETKEKLRALLKALIEGIAKDFNLEPKVVAKILLNKLKKEEDKECP